MWEPQPLAILGASTVCTGITLPYLTLALEWEVAFYVSIRRYAIKIVLVWVIYNSDMTVNGKLL
jgi:membrane associated rhomboid family serine protease